MDYDPVLVRREFEIWVSQYKARMNGQTEEFLRYVKFLHRQRKLLGSDYGDEKIDISDAVINHIEVRAFQDNPSYPSPHAFMKKMFSDFPEVEVLKMRFRKCNSGDVATKLLKRNQSLLETTSSA